MANLSESERMQPQLNLLVHFGENRGDHSTDVALALEYIPGESVDAVVRRAKARIPTYAASDFERIEIRVCQP